MFLMFREAIIKAQIEICCNPYDFVQSQVQPINIQCNSILHGLCWLYGWGSAHTVVEWPVQMIKGNPGHVPKGYRRHGDP